MIAKNLIRTTLTPLKTSDDGNFALRQMADYHVRHLPLVTDAQFVGLIAEDDVFHFDSDDLIGSYSLPLSRPCARENDHLYEVMQKMTEFRLTIIPVIDAAENYVGSITLEDLLQAMAATTAVMELGSIIVIEAGQHNYSLVEIARAVESEGAMILSYFVGQISEDGLVDITLKINRMEISSIIATLIRYDYEIKGAYSESDYSEALQERYDALMSYMSV